jgi:hypothetical protein
MLQAVARVLTTITRASLVLISRLATLAPQLLLFLKVLSNIPASATSLLSDNICFEDVLGRTYSLLCQHFKHWRIFKSMLECAFENMPGQEKVFSRHYRIMNARFQENFVDKLNWEQSIFPGAQFVMSVNINRVKIRLGHCPRVQCSGLTRRLNSAAMVCEECGLYFFTSNPSPIRPVPHVTPLLSETQSPNLEAEAERTRDHLKRLDLTKNGLKEGMEVNLFLGSTGLPSGRARFLDMLKKASEIPQLEVENLRRELRLKALTVLREKPPNHFELGKKAEQVAREREEEELLLFRRAHFIPQDKQPTNTTSSERDPRLEDTVVKHIIVRSFASTSIESRLYHAIDEGDVDQVTKLIENGIDINAMNPESGTPLQTAISLGSDEVVDLLLQYGANPLIGDPVNNAIHTAVLHRNGLVLSLLLLKARNRLHPDNLTDLGVYMDIINRALYVASLRGYNDIVLALVNAGVDALVKLDDYHSALDAALFCVRQAALFPQKMIR